MLNSVIAHNHEFIYLCTSSATLSFSSLNAGQNTADKTIAVSGIESDCCKRRKCKKI